MSAGLRIEGLAKSFDGVRVLSGIDLDVRPGEFVVLLGESGCGKSTLLRLISGLEEEHEGRLLIGDRDVTGLDPKERRIAMVFQSYALYPHMTVFGNISFGMRIRKEPKGRIREEVERVARVLKLDAVLERRPSQLSGGQRQRVAIGRAMVRRPDVFLFDEPLSNLDAKLRGEMRAELKRIHAELGATIVYVTHDQIEAMTLADRIVLLDSGRIEQVGSPEAIFAEPDTLFAARFVGTPEIDTLAVRVHRGPGGEPVAELADGTRAPLPARAARHAFEDGARALLAVRPECLRPVREERGADAPPDGGADLRTRGHRVLLCEPTGSDTYLTLSCGDGALRLRVPGLHRWPDGQRCAVDWDLAGAHLFDPDSGRHL